MTTLSDQILRTNGHDPGVDVKIYIGQPRSYYLDLSQFYPGSNVSTGAGSGWIDYTAYIGEGITLESGEHNAKLGIKGWYYNDTFMGGEVRYILLKEYNSGGGTSYGWVDRFVGLIGQGGDITGLWQSNLYSITGENEFAYLGKTTAPSHKFGPSIISQGKSASASSVLVVPDAEYPLERFSGGQVDASKAVDGLPFDTLWIAQNAPQLANDYYSPVFGTYYRLNEVFGHAAGANDTASPQYIEIIASGSVNWNKQGTRNLGNIQAWDASYMPGGTPGMVGWHINGNTWSLATSTVSLPFNPSPNNQQVLRSSRNGTQVAGMKYIMSPNDAQSSDITVIPIPGWNYKFRLWLRGNLPGDYNNHFIKWRMGGDGDWKYVKLTGDWQLIEGDSDADKVNNGADSYWGIQIQAWSNSDSTGIPDTTVSYIDFARLQVIAGAPIEGAWDRNLAGTYTGQYGLGSLRLKVRNSQNVELADIDLSRYPTKKTKGLQSIIITPARQALETRFQQLSGGNQGGENGPIVIDVSDLYPGVWLDSAAANTTLSNAIIAGVTTIPVVSTTGFSTTGTLQIDNEQISYTGVSSNTFTGATRGVNGTTAAPHTIGTVVGQVTAIGSVELYSAAYIGYDENRNPVTRVPLTTHDIVTINQYAKPVATSYGSYSGAYPSNANYSYQRTPGIFGAWASNIYPSPGVPTMGSTREVIMVDLGTFVYATLANAIGTSDTVFDVDGDPDHVPLNGYIKIGGEYMYVTGLSNTTVTVTRNATVPSTPPTTGTLSSHAAGDSIIPMLPDVTGLGWHQQTKNRVAAVGVTRKDGMSPIVDATIMYATTAAALPTDEYSSGWTQFRRISGNAQSSFIVLAPGNALNPPSYPPNPAYFTDPSLRGLEVREIAIIINHMGNRPDNPSVRDRAKVHELIVYELPTNSGVGGAFTSHSNIPNLVQLFGHMWSTHYGSDSGHPPGEMSARYVPSSSFNYVGIPCGPITVAADTYAGLFQKLADMAGLDWCIDEWGRLNVYFHRHSGLGLAPGQAPVMDFNRTNIRQIQFTKEGKDNVSQVILTGTDQAGRSYTAQFPPRANRVGKLEKRTGLVVFSQDSLNRMARALYNSLNRDWTVVITVGQAEWLYRGALVTLTWDFGNGTEPFIGKVFSVASWRTSYSQTNGVWQVQTQIRLEERKLV